MNELTSYLEKIINMALEFAPSLALAALVLLGGFWAINRITLLLKSGLENAKFSPDLTPFLVSISQIGLKVLLLFSIAGIVGIETASFVAVLAAAGFAVGLALQGSLGNFAAGIIILIFRPYKIGDWIEVQEKFGKVEEIQIFNTLIVTPGSKMLIIPNGQIIDNIVTNFSSKGYIRLELKIIMPYEESFPRIKNMILKELHNLPLVLKSPSPEVGILEFDSHSIIVAARPYVKPNDYWQVTFEAHQAIKAAFSNNDVKMAYSEGVELGKIGD